METDILIIGAGLSGLALAEALTQTGRDIHVVEARDRIGGRIATVAHGSGQFDLGPAWFWPGQPRIAQAIQHHGLKVFDQYAKGALRVEDHTGHVQEGGWSSMQGSWRLHGGLTALTGAMAGTVPADRLTLNAPVTHITPQGANLTATLGDKRTITAQRIVLALPPRVAARIIFDPPLPNVTTQTMRGISTWMAGQAKALAIYDTAFWRDAGLSGDAMSRRGPMVEIHDASANDDGPYALFGFIGVPPQARQDAEALERAVIAQLARLFGPDAAKPTKLVIQDWARDPWTATDADQAPLTAHPTYGRPPALTGLMDGRLIFAGTEVARQFGGYLEGALEAAEDALTLLGTQRAAP